MRPSSLLLLSLGWACYFVGAAVAAEPEPDLIVHHANIVTLDAKNQTFEAVAVRDGRIVAIGEDEDILKRRGPKTRVIDAGGKTVLPGLYDSHVHPLGAAASELKTPLPVLNSLKDVFAHLKKRVAD